MPQIGANAVTDRAPVISIVMAARNAERTIDAAIDSIATQDERDWELIVIDDGSTDRTRDIVAGRAAADPRVRVIDGTGEGASAARNLGIAASRGRWLAFLDSDDWWEPDFLSTMVAALADQPANAIAYCGYWRVMPDGSLTPPKVDPRVAQAPLESFALPCPVTIHTLLLDRAMVAATGGFDTSLTTCEDWDLWQRLSRAGSPWIMVDRPLAYYRASAGSLTRSSRAMMTDGHVVIGRAFRPDPRVAAPLPRYANGIERNFEGQDAGQAYAWFTLWIMVVARLDGDETPVDRALLAPLDRSSGWTRAIAASILDAATVGMRLTLPALAGQWDRLAPTVRWATDQVAGAWGTPDAAVRLQYAVEDQLLAASDDDGANLTLDRTMRVHVEIGAPVPVALPAGVDRILAIFVDRGERVATRMLGVVGDMTASDWREIIPHLAPNWIDATLRDDRWAAAPQIARAALRTAIRNPGAFRSPARARNALRQAAVAGVGTLSHHRAPLPHSHRGRLRALVREADAQAAALNIAPAAAPRLAAPPESARDGDRREFWESYFEHEDPWNYGSPYEQEKYGRQIALLPQAPIGKALELACAEGFFARLLAPKVGALISTDISATAVARASERCRDFDNIEWRTLDLSADSIPSDMDLIVCSEVLYYLDDADELARVTARLADALAPGGSILTAHAFVLTDHMTRTGFDWGNPFGAQRIADTFAATPGLTLDATIETDLYRIDRFRKGPAAATARHEMLRIEAPVEDAVARAIIWNGATIRRADAIASERTRKLPILMYHAVAPDGPAGLSRWRLDPATFRDQIRWLRSNGYQGLTSGQVEWHFATQTPFYGRPVWITFDDGYQDFADIAWPILRAHDFPAEMFVVTGALGQTASWDAALGEPLRLMDAETIARLATEGARFGSHFHDHRAADTLTSRELAQTLANSRALLGRLTGEPPIAFAAPYMVPDTRLEPMTAALGYRIGFGARIGAATLDDAVSDLPRIEIAREMSLDRFAAMLEAARA